MVRRFDRSGGIAVFAVFAVILFVIGGFFILSNYTSDEKSTGVLPPNLDVHQCVGYFTVNDLNVQAAKQIMNNEEMQSVRAIPDITFTQGIGAKVPLDDYLGTNNYLKNYWVATLTIEPLQGGYELVQKSYKSVPDLGYAYEDIDFRMVLPMYVAEEGVYQYTLNVYSHIDGIDASLFVKSGYISTGEIV